MHVPLITVAAAVGRMGTLLKGGMVTFGSVTLACTWAVVGRVQLRRKLSGCREARSLKLKGILTMLKPRARIRCTCTWKSWLKLLPLFKRPSNMVLPSSNPCQVTPTRSTARPSTPRMLALTVVRPVKVVVVVVEAVVLEAAVVVFVTALWIAAATPT